MGQKIYTKKGDQGVTQLLGKSDVMKFDPRVEAYGSVDELNSLIGVLVSDMSISNETDFRNSRDFFLKIQNRLFDIGGQLACTDSEMSHSIPMIKEENVGELESQMDHWNTEIPPQREFVLPGGHPLSAKSQVARTVCRRAERRVVQLAHKEEVNPLFVKYINRLSDTLHVFSRWINHQTGTPESLWQKL